MTDLPPVVPPVANQKPWWAPDSQGFLAGAIVIITGAALFIRMFHPSVQDDKMLDTMITILFSTCLVTVYNFTFGSSRGSADKDASQSKIVEKLTSSVPPATGPVAPVPAPEVIVSWWSLLTDQEQAAIKSAATTDPSIAKVLSALQSGKAEAPDLTVLVAKGLLTQDRATTIKG